MLLLKTIPFVKLVFLLIILMSFTNVFTITTCHANILSRIYSSPFAFKTFNDVVSFHVQMTKIALHNAYVQQRITMRYEAEHQILKDEKITESERHVVICSSNLNVNKFYINLSKSLAYFSLISII